jgi:RNA polymerase sigma factor (sigma-70 family)
MGMTRLKAANLVRDFEALFGAGTLAGLGDGPLLERFIARRDEAAFEELIARHGPVVLAICRRWLDDPRDIEDAFQATFLILVQKAAALRDRNALSSWLYGVALRVVRRARANAARRRARESPIAGEPADRTRALEPCAEDEVLAAVDEEIRRLPENQQLAVTLCLREGYTHEAAASQLGWPLGTVKSRIAAARQTLTRRLTRRGLAPSGVVAGLKLGGASSAISPQLVRLTLETARASLASPGIPAAGTSATITGLIREVLRAMLAARIRSAALVVLALGALAWAAPALLGARPAGKAHTESRPRAAPIAAAPPSRPPKVDRYGDPLPPGAAMRLGTVRFRQASHLKHIAYSPDGQLVVTEDEQDILVVRDTRDGKLLRRIDFGIEGVFDFTFSPDGTSIATVGFRMEPKRNAVANHLTFTEVATGRAVRRGEWDDQDNVETVAYVPDGKTVATVSIKGMLRLWDVATAKPRHEERLGEGRSREATAFSRDAASRMLAIAWGQAIDLWDVAQLRRTRRIAVDGRYHPDCLAFSPDGTTLAAGVASRGSEVRLWRVGDGNLLRRYKSRKNAHVSYLAFSPDGKVLAGIGSGGALVFFDTATEQELDLLPSGLLIDGPLAFSPDGKTLTTTGDRQTLHFWDLAAGKDRLATPEDHQGDVVALAFCNDGKTLVSGSRDRTARIWDLATGRSTRMLPHGGWVEPLLVSADGSLLATGSVSSAEWGTVRVWNLRTGEPLHTWPAERTILRGLTLSADGSSAIAAYGDGSLRRWDVSTGKEHPIARPKMEKLPPRGPGGVSEVARAVFSPDGRSLALLGGDCVQLIDVASGQLRFKASAPSPASPASAFAPDGRSLAVVGRMTGRKIRAGNWVGSRPVASTITWLDSQTGHVRREIDVPESYVHSLAFSPDGQAIAVANLLPEPARGIIRIFRLRDKQETQTIETPSPWIEALAFTPDGKQIVAGLSDTSIVIWDVRPTD